MNTNRCADYVSIISYDRIKAERDDLTHQLREMRNSRDLEKEANKEITRQLADANTACEMHRMDVLNLTEKVIPNLREQLAEAKAERETENILLGKLAAADFEIARANDGIGYWTKQCADLVSQIEIVNIECEALRDGIVDSNENIAKLESEIARLRKALKRISTLEYQKLQFEYCKRIAKAALEASDESHTD